jgi:flavin reductase (DIM6/NTAB) family NADH-FMN oxidoreductase RutF
MTRTVTRTVSLEKDFRKTMGNVASPVAVVTTFQGKIPHGSTVSAFTSLSMEPPMLLVSLDNNSTLLPRLEIGTRFGLNLLASHQDQIALRFAQKRERKFEDIPWFAEDAAPRIVDAHGWVALDVASLIVAGDHTIVTGLVSSAQASIGTPLTYYQRSFGTHRAF